MKRFFSLMLIALVSCAMMVSCDKEENTTNNNQGGNGGNGGNQTVNGVTVKFGNATWTANELYGAEANDAEGLLILMGWDDYNNEQAASFFCQLPSMVANVEQSEDNYYLLMYSQNDDDVFTYQNQTYPAWQTDELTEKVTAIDLTAMTLTATAEGMMTDYKTYIETEGQTDNTAAINVTFTNASWEAPSKAVKSVKVIR